MKRIFMIAMLMLTAMLTAQNATWTGTKTFGSTLKFANVLQNNANTRIMSLDAIGKPGWVDKSTLSSPINLETESQAQNPFWFYSQNLRVGYSIQLGKTIGVDGSFATLKSTGVEYGSYNENGSSIWLNAIYYPENLYNSNVYFSRTFAMSVNGYFADYYTGNIEIDSDLSVYADNAAAIAGGLSVNKKYRTATGQVMIVY